jgi:polysaccharide biosynthesis protein PslA
MTTQEQRWIGGNKPAAERVARPVGWRHFTARVLDILIAATGLALFAPILLLTAAAIKLDSQGPVFVRETRMASKNRRMKVLKFRLATGGPHRGYARATRIGDILRDTGVAELPALFNVLRGDLSIVGRQDQLVSFRVLTS